MSNLTWSFCRLLLATIWQQQFLLIFQLLKNFKIGIIHLKVPRQRKNMKFTRTFLSSYLCCMEAYVSQTCIQSSCHVLEDLQKYFFKNNNTCNFINLCFILKQGNLVKFYPCKCRIILKNDYQNLCHIMKFLSIFGSCLI